MTRNEEIIFLRKQGLGAREIARHIKVSPGTVSGVLFRAGLTKPLYGRGNGASPEFKRRAGEALEHSTWQDVTERFGIVSSTLSVWRRELSAEAVR